MVESLRVRATPRANVATEITKQPRASSSNDLSSTNHSKGSRGSHASSGTANGRVIYKRADGSTGVSSRDVFDKIQRISDTRKSSISDSLGKFGLDGSFRDDKPLLMKKQKDVYACDDDISDGSYDSADFSIGDEPTERTASVGSIGGAGEFNTAFVFSLDSPALQKSNNHRHIKTSASDDQWCRFKLLGREGFGKIQVSDPAQVLIDKNIQVLTEAVKHVIALRKDDSIKNCKKSVDIFTGQLMDEVKQTLDVPTEKKADYKRDPNSIFLDATVEAQLRDYVTVISCMYRDNGFHNFEHASQEFENDKLGLGDGIGIITDPWTHFALILSALIHDVDHAGVPNEQLIKERSAIAGAYKDKSVAEQNSIELAWNLLMEPGYRELREAIFVTPEEVSKFRRLVVTFVLATDIANKELATLRRDRAEQAMTAKEKDENVSNIASRKATYIMETVMQAADVSHTMQPFPIYKKWNQKLYQEMYTAFLSGRAENDPTDSWYQGDIGFFDFYIIPLAKKLVACEVLDNEKAENLLNNAISNRQAWAAQGEEIVASYREGIQSSGRSLVSIDKSLSTALSELSDCDMQSDCDGDTASNSSKRETFAIQTDQERDSDILEAMDNDVELSLPLNDTTEDSKRSPIKKSKKHVKASTDDEEKSSKTPKGRRKKKLASARISKLVDKYESR